MKRIKLNIEIELEGKEAKAFVKRLEQLSDAITGSATVSQQAKPLPPPTPKKVKKVTQPSGKETKKAAPPSSKTTAVKKPGPKKPGRKPKFAAGEFIEAWNSSGGTAEVAQKLGVSRATVSSRATYLRAAGHNLKKFKPGRPKSN